MSVATTAWLTVSLSGGDAWQPVDTQLTSIAGLSYTGNSLKVMRVNAGETGFELATITSGPSAANPTATIGLTAVNGAAATFLRSDGAPALDVGIAPTWTAPHTFSAGATVGSPSGAGGNLAVLSVLGAELAPDFTAGNWTATNGWAANGAGVSITRVNNGSTGTITPSAATAIVAGNLYKVVIVVSAISGNILFTLGGTYGPYLVNGTNTLYIQSVSTANFILSGAATTTITITSISVTRVDTTTGGINATGGLVFRSPLQLNQGGGGVAAVSVPALSFVPQIGNAMQLDVAAGGSALIVKMTGQPSSLVLRSGGMDFASNGAISWSNTSTNPLATLDTYLTRGGTANLQLGKDAANPPVAQTLSVQDASGTDIAGAAWTFRGSRGTGAGLVTGKSFSWQTPDVGTTGTTLQTATEKMYLLGTGALGLTTGLITPKIYPAADSTTAVQFMKADGTTPVVTIDTTNSSLLVPNGVAAHPAVAFAGSVNTGLHWDGTSVQFAYAGSNKMGYNAGSCFTNVDFSIAGWFYLKQGATGGIGFGSGHVIAWQSTSTNAGVTGDLFIQRAGAANLQFGATAANPPVAQTLSVQDASGTDIAGAVWTHRASRGTGTGTPGTHVFQTSTPGTTGTTLQTATTRFTISHLSVTSTLPIVFPASTVAALPAGVAYARAFVTDALAPVWGAAVAGGGAVVVPVYFDGAAWNVG